MEINWINPDEVEASDRDRAEARIQHLAEGHEDLQEVRVAVKPNSHHRHGGNEVRITAVVKGKTLVAARERADAGEALHDSVVTLESEIRRLREKRSKRRAAPHHGQGEIPESGS
jgi:ribosome-associated translation inhibitor RaiA